MQTPPNSPSRKGESKTPKTPSQPTQTKECPWAPKGKGRYIAPPNARAAFQEPPVRAFRFEDIPGAVVTPREVEVLAFDMKTKCVVRVQ